MNQETQQHANGDYAGFFSDAAQVLDIAKQAQANLDHKAATGFSVFDYFRSNGPNENDLSRVFAGLLNPRGEHGQREAFLRCFLDEMKLDGYPAADKSWTVDIEYSVTVENEKFKPVNKRIDIVLNHPPSGSWLGIENKPEAKDQPNQMRDYLKSLREKDGNARVCYLSGRGEDSATICESDKDRCLTVPYRKNDKLPSVEGWIERCLLVCEAEPVRWFLKDLLKYVRYQFSMEGAPAIDYKGDVMTDTMKEFIIERSKSDARAWDTAALVEKAMPEVRAELIKRFVAEIQECLSNWVKEKNKSAEGSQWMVSSTSGDDHMKKYAGQVVLHRKDWKFNNPVEDGDGWLAAGAALNAQRDFWMVAEIGVAAPKEYPHELSEENPFKRLKDDALLSKSPLLGDIHFNDSYRPTPVRWPAWNAHEQNWWKRLLDAKSSQEAVQDLSCALTFLATKLDDMDEFKAIINPYRSNP